MAQDIRNISLYLGQGNVNSQHWAPATGLSSPGEKKTLPVSAEERRRQELIQLIWSQSSGPSDLLDSLGAGIEMDSPASSSLSSPSQLELQQAILRSLRSDVMEARRGAVSPAHERTFQWIFEPPQNTGNATPGGPPWANFVSWLEKDDTDQIYWITGKPGSGKSTLMKYIVESGQLESHLQRWAGETSVKTAVFYSWNAGTDEQRTEIGLLRSILHQYMTQMPDLLPAVCSRRWAIYRLFGTDPSKLPPWTKTELRQAFDALLPLARQSSHKLVLFIDGLDEFQVPDKFRFLLSFAETVRAGGAKVCTSSRDWTVFADYFRANPSLRLQDLTRGDIEWYIRDHLDQSVAYAELKESDAEGLERLVASVLNKASGVFLWVRMVTEVVLAGMEDGETVKELKERVDELPPDLCDLYQGIWNKLDPKGQTTVARMLRLLEACTGNLTAPIWFAAEQSDAEEALKMPFNALEKLVVRRLRSQTRGLLEISEFGLVDYLHRTARDWSLTIEDKIQEMLPPDFDPNLQLLLAEVAIRTVLNTPGSWSLDRKAFWSGIGLVLEYARDVVIHSNDSTNAGKVFAALDRLDKWATDSWEASGHQLYVQQLRNRKDDKLDIHMHWSSYQSVGAIDAASLGYSNTFLGVACQYALLPYVKQKLGVCPKLVMPKQGEVSLLENALLIPEMDIWNPRYGRPISDFGRGFPHRDALLRLLLTHGADPSAVPLLLLHTSPVMFHIKPHEAGLRNLPLYKIVKALSVKREGLVWKKVQAVFAENMKKRGTFSRLGERISRITRPATKGIGS